jgi:hypothetical protein
MYCGCPDEEPIGYDGFGAPIYQHGISHAGQQVADVGAIDQTIQSKPTTTPEDNA